MRKSITVDGKPLTRSEIDDIQRVRKLFERSRVRNLILTEQNIGNEIPLYED